MDIPDDENRNTTLDSKQTVHSESGIHDISLVSALRNDIYRKAPFKKALKLGSDSLEITEMRKIHPMCYSQHVCR
jgi:hypothetical protein